MKHTNHKTSMVLDFFCSGIWALCAVFNIAGGDYLMGAVSMVLFTVFMATGMVNRQKMKQ